VSPVINVTRPTPGAGLLGLDSGTEPNDDAAVVGQTATATVAATARATRRNKREDMAADSFVARIRGYGRHWESAAVMFRRTQVSPAAEVTWRQVDT
jgi:hypothetical protein